ncbi:MAG: SH3 domain-containing protein [Ardenticatenaceae bacterium]|nr:SH3 domain-containing protein [Ardenticatenaceae bacterium]
MEEEYPSVDEQTEAPRSGSKTLYVVGAIVVLALIIAGISLPPISIWERIGGGTEESVTGEQVLPTPETADPTETAAGTTAIPGEVTLNISSGTASVSSVPSAEFAGTNALPTTVSPRSNVYALEGSGNGRIAVTIPVNTNLQFADLYAYNGSSWAFVPSEVDVANQQIVSADGPLPQAVVLAETAQPGSVAVAAEVRPTQELPAEVLPHLTEVVVGTLTLVGDGDVQGEITAVPAGVSNYFVRVTNTGAIIDEASLAALLSDPNTITTHVNRLVGETADAAGLNLDYQGVNPANGTAFTNFVTELADALHAQGKLLALTLGTPQAVSDGWNTGGQNWAALGQVADIVYVQTPLNPAAYGDNETAEQLLNWASRQIDRQKLTLLVSTNAIDGIGEAYLPLANDQALAALGQLQFTAGATEIMPGEAVEVAFDSTATPLEWDGSSLTYKFTYDLSGQVHTVWLGSEAALAYRLRLADRHHLRGVAVQGLGQVQDGAAYATALQSYLGAAEAPAPAGAAIVWTVRDESDSVVASDSGDALGFAWENTQDAGLYTVYADFALGESTSNLAELAVTVMSEETADAGLGEAEVEEEESEATPTPAPEETTDTGVSGTSGQGVVTVNANVRSGPGLGYPTVGGLAPETAVSLIGRSSDSAWYQVVTPDNEEVWIFGQLVAVQAGFEVSSLPVPDVAPAVASTGGDGGSSGGGAPTSPPPVVPPANIGGGFEFGGQTHTFANPTLMAYSGMNWVKFQHKWGEGDTPDAVAGRIQQAHANGFKVLLSIPGANHSSINYQAYVNFVGGVAALGPDAIEIWNEQNIDREWPAGQIDPAAYVTNMLAPAYNAIKAANPNVMVISGAPAPTGFFGGCGGGGCNDDLYMAGMAAAGGANYMDCIGIHYNEGIISPSQTSGDPRNPSAHYTRYFWGMVNTYSNAFGGSRPLCFTELGYLSGDDYGGVPGGFAWAGTTSIGEHAQWLAEAVSLASNSGRVRLLIIFNVDFTHYSADPQAGYAMIRKDGSCPACETLHQATGGR